MSPVTLRRRTSRLPAYPSDVDSCEFMVEFTVGSDVNIEERPSPVNPRRAIVPNPVLAALRSSLDADERVHLIRVESVVRIGDRPRQQLLVSVQVFCNNRDDGLRSAQEAVSDIVGHVVPSATYSGVDDIV